MDSRAEICLATAERLEGADARRHRAVLGFDGFVDDITDVVEMRQGAGRYQRVEAMAAFARRVAAAAGQSANMELVVRQRKLGGNGPIMGNALAALGFPITYIGPVGDRGPGEVFEEFAARATLLSLGEPAHTTALEFGDGKVMLGNLAPLAEVTWERIVERVGVERLVGLWDAADLLGALNWTMLPHLTEIWRHLAAEVLPRLGSVGGRRRGLFVDLADPRKRSAEDLLEALGVLGDMSAHVDVMLGLNISEAEQVARALGWGEGAPGDRAELAARLCRELRLGPGGAVVIHSREGSSAASGEAVARFAGPLTPSPKISTGAGDHFNAGFAAGRVLGWPLEQALALATATSGYYVRTAATPGIGAAAGFLRELASAPVAGR